MIGAPPPEIPQGGGVPPPAPPPSNPLTHAPPPQVVVENPLLRIPEGKRHQLERVAIMVDAWIDHQVEELSEWYAPDDRAPFEIPLSDEEILERAHDVKWVQAYVAELQSKGEVGGIRKFLDELMALEERSA